jgi:hypothetical protein
MNFTNKPDGAVKFHIINVSNIVIEWDLHLNVHTYHPFSTHTSCVFSFWGSQLVKAAKEILTKLSCAGHLLLFVTIVNSKLLYPETPSS